MGPLTKYLMQAKGMTMGDIAALVGKGIKGGADAVRKSPTGAAVGAVGGLGAGYLLGDDSDANSPEDEEMRRRLEEERLLREVF